MEAADNRLMPPSVAAAISRVKGAKRTGIRTGQWLTREQAENLISAPDATENKGKRDRALLAVLIGCGLRHREAAALTVDHIQLRDARWVIVDLIGKGGRVRTVPMPSWTKSAIDSWIAAVEISEGLVFRAINKSGRVTGTSITPRGIFQVVQRFGDEIGAPKLAPHDL
jgi:integrase